MAPMSDLNDPRVLFAAERTLLAWNRTGMALMGFGVAVDRASLILPGTPLERTVAFWIGIVFVVAGIHAAFHSVLQFRKVLTTLRPVEVPEGYWVHAGMVSNLIVAALGLVLLGYLILGYV